MKVTLGNFRHLTAQLLLHQLRCCSHVFYWNLNCCIFSASCFFVSHTPMQQLNSCDKCAAVSKICISHKQLLLVPSVCYNMTNPEVTTAVNLKGFESYLLHHRACYFSCSWLSKLVTGTLDLLVCFHRVPYLGNVNSLVGEICILKSVFCQTNQHLYSGLYSLRRLLH